uniref:hypothetical protein n=1 Tax=Frankia tisae TaxID=2950104 RepID=UPI0021BFB0C8
DIAEEWIRSNITKAETDSDRTTPIPVWVSIGDLDGPLGNYIANEIGLPALSQLGVDIVVDGLDEHTDKAATALRQAAEFVAKWPNSRVVLTSRSQEKISSHLVVPAPSLSKAHAARMMARVAGHEIGSLGTHLESAVERPFFALLVARHATAAEGATGIPELIDLVVE